ncbi:response regulator, partial [candidate division KSB1 bacterium]|nr:response regulator [candidate division KSB1 bacterium]
MWKQTYNGNQKLKSHMFLFFTALLLFWSQVVTASSGYIPQTVDMIDEKFTWTQFNDITGMGAHCLAEDSSGFLWFGLENGIMRYDGLYWRHFSQHNGLPNSFVQNIVTSPDRRLFAVYETAGVFVLQDTVWQQVSTVEYDSSVVFWDITFTGSDSLWISTNRGALLKTKTGMTLYTPEGIFQPDVIRQEHTSLPQSSSIIYRVYEDRDKNLWLVDISKFNSKLYFIKNWRKNIHDLSIWRAFSNPEQGNAIVTRPQIYQSADGTFWIYSYNELSGIYTFKDPGSVWNYINLVELGGNNLVLSVLETRDSTIWFGGNGYLYSFRDNLMKIYTPNDLDIQIAPIELLQSRDGALWILSLNAEVYRIDYSRKNWNILKNLHFQCDTGQGLSYFISSDGKIVSFDAGTSLWQSYDEKDGLMNMPLVVLSTRDEKIWAAGSDRGIAAVSRFDGKNWHTETFLRLSWSISYLSALEAADGRLWFGSMGDPAKNFLGGCIVYEKVNGKYRWQHILSETESYNRVGMLTQTKDGTIWAGGSHLLYFDGQKFRPVSEPQELQRGWIDHVYAASNGDLFAAKGGVAVFHKSNKKWNKYTIEDNLASNMATHFLETANNQILVSTERGISQYDGKSWTEFCFPREIKINRESGTMKQAAGGKIWINLAPRTWYFRATNWPSELEKRHPQFRTISYSRDNLPPETQIYVYQQRLTKPANQYLAWKGFDFWGATVGEELSFVWQLDEKTWSEFSTQNSVQFLNMKDGRHIFRVRARDRDGNIDPTPAVVRFTVLPVIWKQPWFILLILLFSSAIIVLFVSLAINNRKLAHANKEIEKIASFKERFFLNVSHEIRTPLTLMLAPLSKLLSQKQVNRAVARNQLELMRHHGHYLLQIVNQLLNFRKMETGQYKLQVSKGDIVSYIQKIKDLFNHFAKEHSIDYTYRPAMENLTAWFDSEKLETVLMNLIGNAIKFTPDGGSISVHLKQEVHRQKQKWPWENARVLSLSKRLSRLNKTSNWVIITVSDSGIGIPKSRLKHIFNRFYHVEHPGRLFYDSIGIGLDFTKEILELHKGSVSVVSKEGAGSTFTVTIPIDRSFYKENEILPATGMSRQLSIPSEKLEEIKESRQKLLLQRDDAGAKPEYRQENIKPSTEQPRILIVEDHPDMRQLLNDFLRDTYEIFEAENGKRGFEMALQIVPDLVISDIMMPKMDGLEFTRKLKSNIVTSHIPVILLTVKNEIEHKIKGFETGADAYIPKPFDNKELSVRIRKLVEMREQLKQRFIQNRDFTLKNEAITPLDDCFMENCQKSVEKHLSEQEFNVDMFCKDIGMSRTQAYRKLKSITGFSLNEFIIHIKLKYAAQLLICSSKNISEIAYSLGFCDHAHLSRH